MQGKWPTGVAYMLARCRCGVAGGLLAHDLLVAIYVCILLTAYAAYSLLAGCVSHLIAVCEAYTHRMCGSHGCQAV